MYREATFVYFIQSNPREESRISVRLRLKRRCFQREVKALRGLRGRGPPARQGAPHSSLRADLLKMAASRRLSARALTSRPETRGGAEAERRRCPGRVGLAAAAEAGGRRRVRPRAERGESGRRLSGPAWGCAGPRVDLAAGRDVESRDASERLQHQDPPHR